MQPNYLRKNQQKAAYVYIIFEESDKVNKIKGINAYEYLNSKKWTDVSFVDDQWTWIYLKSHEEFPSCFNIGPYFYEKK
jgi:hypothetical protein